MCYLSETVGSPYLTRWDSGAVRTYHEFNFTKPAHYFLCFVAVWKGSTGNIFFKTILTIFMFIRQCLFTQTVWLESFPGDTQLHDKQGIKGALGYFGEEIQFEFVYKWS